MGLDLQLLQEIANEDLSELPKRKGLHLIGLDDSPLKTLAETFANNEGEWCKFGVTSMQSGYHGVNTEIQFQIGQRGLYLGKSGKLMVDVRKKSNWGFGNRHEGYILENRSSYKSNSKGFGITRDGFKLPIPHSSLRIREYEASFGGRRSSTLMSGSSKKIEECSIGDFDESNEFDTQREYAKTRLMCTPFKIKHPEEIDDRGIFNALMVFQNGLVNEGKLEEVLAMNIGRLHHGFTSEDLARNQFDPIRNRTKPSEERAVRDANTQVQKHVEAAKNKLISAYAIRKTWDLISDSSIFVDDERRVHGYGNGFNGESEYWSGRIGVSRGSYKYGAEIPANVMIIPSPNNPLEIWARPIDRGGQRRLRDVHQYLQEVGDERFHRN